MANDPPAILTIAGTDSSGGAGIQVYSIFGILNSSKSTDFQADMKTFSAYRCYGTSVVTAMTAQNTTGIQAVHPAPPEFVKQQVRITFLQGLMLVINIHVDSIRSRRCTNPGNQDRHAI